MTIRYSSTNRNLDGVEGIAPFKGSVTFREALLQGQAPDEGLFMPDAIPFLPPDELMMLKGAPYVESAMLVAEAFLREEVPRDVLRRIVEDAYDFPVPLETVIGRKYLMRLD
ncbi:MAG TPA: threonine synthase, partial [Syntrophales bacterium]|nr:threonine synthase [Syntrophales bacterium]